MVRYKVTLTAEERQRLEKLVSSGKGAARKLTHAQILLLADEGDHGPGRSNAAIVAAERFVTESFESALQPRPQPPRPDKVKIKGPVGSWRRGGPADLVQKQRSIDRWPGSGATPRILGSYFGGPLKSRSPA